MPLGYVGTAPHLKDVPGKRPTVEMPITGDFLKKIRLTLNGQEVKHTELTLPRGQEVDLQGRFDFDLGENGQLGLSRIMIVSHARNEQGFLGEGEALLVTSFQHTSGAPFGFDISQKWRVPDRAGEFFLIADYFIFNTEKSNNRRFAIVCPVVLK